MRSRIIGAIWRDGDMTDLGMFLALQAMVALTLIAIGASA